MTQDDLPTPRLCTAFTGLSRLAQGPLPEVALAVRAALAADPHAAVLVFEDATGQVVDLDLRGSDAEVLARLVPPSPPAAGRGRPKLGVTAREVTLLPRHWDWLAAQPGGASNTLRRLIDAARHSDGDKTRARQARESAYRVMMALGGDLPGFEDASRALFADDRDGFARQTADWPQDLRRHVTALAWPD